MASGSCVTFRSNNDDYLDMIPNDDYTSAPIYFAVKCTFLHQDIYLTTLVTSYFKDCLLPHSEIKTLFKIDR